MKNVHKNDWIDEKHNEINKSNENDDIDHSSKISIKNLKKYQ